MKVKRHLPADTLQDLTVLSQEPLTMRLGSVSENATLNTPPVVVKSQPRTVLENSKENCSRKYFQKKKVGKHEGKIGKRQGKYTLECPFICDRFLYVPINTFHNLIVLSSEPLMMRLGFVGENATLQTL